MRRSALVGLGVAALGMGILSGSSYDSSYGSWYREPRKKKIPNPEKRAKEKARRKQSHLARKK